MSTTTDLHDPLTCTGCDRTTTNVFADMWLIVSSPADDRDVPFCSATCIARWVLHTVTPEQWRAAVTGR